MQSEEAGAEGSKSRLLYWTLQLTGWGGYFGLAAAGMYAADRRAVVLVVWLAIMLGHLAGSHALRFIIKRNKWVRLPLSKLLLRLLGTVGLFAVLVELLVAPLAAVAGIATYRQQLSMYWLYVVATFILFSLWSFCYVAFVRYRESEMRTLRLKASLREAELQALKSQVNPHFLFNCLNNLRSLVAEDAEKAREMLLRLSELLRYSLEAGLKEKVSLREELQVVQAYLELEKLQFETRLKWRIEANVESRQAMVPPMFVQQLVENAVKHGISQQAEGGRSLSARVFETAILK